VCVWVGVGVGVGVWVWVCGCVCLCTHTHTHIYVYIHTPHRLLFLAPNRVNDKDTTISSCAGVRRFFFLRATRAGGFLSGTSPPRSATARRRRRQRAKSRTTPWVRTNYISEQYKYTAHYISISNCCDITKLIQSPTSACQLSHHAMGATN